MGLMYGPSDGFFFRSFFVSIFFFFFEFLVFWVLLDCKNLRSRDQILRFKGANK